MWMSREAKSCAGCSSLSPKHTKVAVVSFKIMNQQVININYKLIKRKMR